MVIRFSIFIFGLILFTLWGLVKPFQEKPLGLGRLLSNISLGALGAIIATLLFPGGLYALGWWANREGVGLFNQGIFNKTPYELKVLLTVIFMDLAIYWQHVLSHRIPYLWRFHKIHHADPEFDTTTALRFHPGEILISFLYKAFFLILLGLDKDGFLIFEALLNFSAMFNHGNFRLPQGLEKVLRKVIVTPDYHRVHHSPIREHTNCNFGFFFSIWDSLFKTKDQHWSNAEVFGLDNEPYSSSRNLWTLLVAPFRG